MTEARASGVTIKELVTKTIMDQHVRDNLIFLKDPTTKLFTLNQVSDYTTTSTSFANVDNTADTFNLTLDTAGGDVLIGAMVNCVRSTSPQNTFFDIELDGVRIGGDDGIIGIRDPLNAAPGTPVPILYWKRSLAAGSHTFKLQWKVSTGTGTILSGAGTSGGDLHPQFWVREVS